MESTGFKCFQILRKKRNKMGNKYDLHNDKVIIDIIHAMDFLLLYKI